MGGTAADMIPFIAEKSLSPYRDRFYKPKEAQELVTFPYNISSLRKK
jgi:hypothetical protein